MASRFHPLTLSFRDGGLEKTYREVSGASNLPYVRLGLLLSISVWVGYIAAIKQTDSPTQDETVSLVATVMIPYLVVMAGATRWLRSHTWQQLLAGSGNVLAGVVAAHVAYTAMGTAAYTLLANLITTIFAYFLLTLRFGAATVSVVPFTTYTLYRVAPTAPEGRGLFVFHLFLCFVGVAMAGLGAYLLERARRNAFYEKHELDEAHRQLRHAQTQLIQSEKLASLGKLVAGVAHDINTPLGVIRSNHQTVHKAVGKLEKVLADHPTVAEEKKVRSTLTVLGKAAETMAGASDRVDEVIRRLRSFARLDEAKLQDVALSRCVEDVVATMRPHVPSGIEVVRDEDESLELRCFPAELNQLLSNVLTNSLDAIETDGTITVRTRHEGDGILLEVEDDGVGIESADMDKVCDPGFTTKGVGVGAGLGLSIALQIARQHGGSLELESERGKGTVVRVRLPKSGPRNASPTSAR